MSPAVLSRETVGGDREKARKVGCDDDDTTSVEFSHLTQQIETLLVAECIV